MINFIKGIYIRVKQSLSKKLDECIAWKKKNKKTVAYIRVAFWLIKAALFIRSHWHWVEIAIQIASRWFLS